LDAGWSGLVDILDEGGYTRYDFSTATKIFNVFGELKKRYEGSFWKLYDSSRIVETLNASSRLLVKV
jgi:hypothetical protein